MKKKIKMYRSISINEYAKLLLGIPIDGRYNPLHIQECGNNGYYGDIICTFEEKIRWKDSNHELLITLEIDEDRILGKGESIWWMPKSFATTKTYCGKRGNDKWILNEYYLKQYSILDVIDVSFNYEVSEENYYIMNSIKRALGLLEFKSTYLLKKDYSYEEVLECVNKLIKSFPNSNTQLKKEEYEEALFSFLYKAFKFSKKKIA